MPGPTTLEDDPPIIERARGRLARDLREPRFKVPKARTEFVRRADLLERLELERARPLVLVCAPAGYGKTTLLTQWVHESGRPAAWVTIEEGDCDRQVLTGSIADALARIGIEPGSRQSFTLVLDDAHVAPPEVLKHAVLQVLGWLPEGSRLAIASRCDSPLALGRIRAQRMLFEIHAEDLSMSVAEASSLLRRAGVELDSSTVHTLARRTEGWPAVLELAVLASPQRPQPAEPAAQLRGDDHLISEYFRSEVVASLSPATMRFLMRSSVLDQLSGPLCDEVLGRTRSAVVLAELARGSVPLQPVDASHEWYRVHGLFREMLQTELRRAEPQIPPALHRRAGDWHCRAGNLDRAIDHARGAEDLDRTGALLWPNLQRYLGEGRNRQVQWWLSGVGADRMAACVPLALVAAHSHLAAGSVALAEQWARSASVGLSDAPEESAKPERAGVLIIEAWAARSGANAMGDAAARAYDLLPEDDPWRASCCFLRGTAALLIGDEGEARQRLEEGAARGAILAPDTSSLCLAQLAVLAAERGQTEYASDLALRARSVVDEHELGEYPTSALVFAICAGAAMLDGRVDEAKTAVAHCLGLLGLLDDSLCWYGAEARILLARASLALADVAGARELLADASRLGRRTPDVVVFQHWFEDVWDQFDSQAETALAGAASLTTAELRVLRFLPTHYSFHEIAQRLHVSSNTVKTHVHAVYRKLDASSRSQAVAQATHAGLLG